MPQLFGPMAAAARDLKAFRLNTGAPGLPTMAVPQSVKKPMAAATFSAAIGLSVVGSPTLRIYQGKDGAGIIEIRLYSQWTALLTPGDWQQLDGIARGMIDQFRAYSRGPLSLATLRRLGHPYGRQPNKAPRAFPKAAGRAVRASAGVRGSVPTYSVVNLQSGTFERGWHYWFEKCADGVVLNFTNTATTDDGISLLWLLTAGTKRMAAHSPATVVGLRGKDALNTAWRAMMGRAARLAATIV